MKHTVEKIEKVKEILESLQASNTEANSSSEITQVEVKEDNYGNCYISYLCQTYAPERSADRMFLKIDLIAEMTVLNYDTNLSEPELTEMYSKFKPLSA